MQNDSTRKRALFLFLPLCGTIFSNFHSLLLYSNAVIIIMRKRIHFRIVSEFELSLRDRSNKLYFWKGNFNKLIRILSVLFNI